MRLVGNPTVGEVCGGDPSSSESEETLPGRRGYTVEQSTRTETSERGSIVHKGDGCSVTVCPAYGKDVAGASFQLCLVGEQERIVAPPLADLRLSSTRCSADRESLAVEALADGDLRDRATAQPGELERCARDILSVRWSASFM